MTPAARLAAAIEVLDPVLAGAPVEQVLTNWGRAHRFAGSGDRYALRDLVFAALRCRRSFAALGGGMTGRGLVLGLVRAQGQDPASLFTGQGHAPAVVEAGEAGRVPEGDEALDVPDWLAPGLRASLGGDYEATMRAMQHRAPVYLRVNVARITQEAALARLAQDGIGAEPVDWVKTAVKVIDNERKIQTSGTFLEGLVELQDASSQAVIAALDLRRGMRVLDYCAGGGGKTLALAAAGLAVDAHDAAPQRMAGLPDRAARAGAKVRIVSDPVGPYDLVLMDVPCSGSGSWRRDPQGKWALTPEGLATLTQTQAAILDRCVRLVAPGGVLAYATCSLLRDENEAQIAAFLARHPGWTAAFQTRFSPLQGGDGFFVAKLTQSVEISTQP
jgi:16S rRNA (cytosine967-C5)-methyltransferase